MCVHLKVRFVLFNLGFCDSRKRSDLKDVKYYNYDREKRKKQYADCVN